MNAALAAHERASDEADDDQADPNAEGADLVVQARDIKKALNELEERLWVPEETKGIVYSDDRVWNRVGYVLGSMQSSWEPPTEAQRSYLESSREAAAMVLAELAVLDAGAVEAFRRAVREAGLQLMPGQDIPRVD